MEAHQQNGWVETSTAQRALIAIDLIKRGFTYDDARARAHVGNRAIEKVRGVLNRRPDLEGPMRNGEMTLNAACSAAGFITKSSEIRLGQTFGKGDKWLEATEPLLRYLDSWQVRNFEFKHLNPRQAEGRLKRIALLEALLEQAKVDLRARAVKAQLSVDSH